MISDRMDINRVLAEMRTIKAQAQSPQTANVDQLSPRQVSLNNSSQTATETPSFGQLMNQAVDSVSGLQKTSKQLATAYEQGQSGVDITDVMIASQKASVSFQAMVQVRNKLIDAYRDVMNMPV
ncbi:MAG: flagellar hook-basal body complex protein FliE [Candidatus Endobugula sp.]|jgi:flagellar hook-basal body complex protein FliE